MRLVFNAQNLVTGFSWDQAAKMIADAGFDAADYFLKEMTDPSCVFNSAQWLDAALDCKAAFCGAGIPIVQAHAPFSFQGWDDPAVYETFIYPTILRSVQVAAVMGAECIVVHPLHYGTYAGHEQEIFERNMKFYRSLIPVCEAYGIKVAIENMFQRDKLRGNYIIHDTCSRVEEFCRYIDTLDSPYMVACLDVGHVGLPSGNPGAWEFIRILGHDRLQALHIHDNDYTNDQHSLPYSGSIDWSKVTRALGEIDYAGDFTYECLLNKKYNFSDPAIFPPVLKYAEQIGRYLISQVEASRRK